MVASPPKPYCQIQIREKCMAGSPPKPYICLLFSGFSNVYHFPCFWLFCVSQFSSFPTTHLVVISNLRHQIIIIIINIMTKLKTLSWVMCWFYYINFTYNLVCFYEKYYYYLFLRAVSNAPAAILSSIESAYLLSNPFPSKPSIVFSAQKPFYSQPNYSSWGLGF